MASKLTLRFLSALREVAPDDWNRLLGEGSPFLRWEWLEAFEGSDCVGEHTGWIPYHLVAEKDGRVVGGCPAYLKLHGMGEFVFDHDWAEFARRAGIRYYPKLLVGVPFTPVSGRRFLTAEGEERKSLVQGMAGALIGLAEKSGLSSIHVNFCDVHERQALEEIGFMPRLGLQFHWENRGYGSFDDFLGAFRADRRNKIKRERREIGRQGISIRVIEGPDLTAGDLDTAFALYKTHIDRLYYGRQYLTESFFAALARRFSDPICLIFAERGGRVIAGTFNVRDREALYGRYWGAFQEERYLHFNVCYYAAIEHCIARGLKRFEAGAGGSFKRMRGLDPRPTWSLHYIVDERFRRAVGRYLHEERELLSAKQAALEKASQLKKEN
jgi:hypothetical protein